MTKDPKDQLKSEMDALLAPAKRVQARPQPFHLAKLKRDVSSSSPKSSLHFWKYFALGNFACLLLVTTLLFKSHFSPSDPLAHKVKVNEAYIVKFDLQPMRTLQAQLVEIELPEGIVFYSQANPSVADKRSIYISIDVLEQMKALPIAFRGQEKGEREIAIRFLDEAKNLIDKKTVKVVII